MSDHHEVERTFAPDPRVRMPDLAAVRGVARVGPPVTTDLDAAYLDTADLDLVRAGITLRHRTGGDDEGWQLKLPAGEGRDELHEPLGSERVPDRLRGLVSAYVREEELGVVATISTRRTTIELLDEDDVVLACVCDDEVTGRLPDGPTISWREWEVELVECGPDLIDAVGALFAEEGVRPAEVQRKVATILGDRLEEPRPPDHVLVSYLVDQVEALRREDVAIRRGHTSGVHQVRVASRRIRSALAAYRPLVDTEVTEPLRGELRWLGRALSGTRDAVVAGELLLEALDAEPPDLVHGPIRDRVRATYESRSREGLVEVTEVLGSQRYLRLLNALHELATDPPLRPRGADSQKALAKRVRKQVQRLAARLDDVREAGSPEERELAWHEARKAAKRLRYAAEVARPSLGKPAKRLVSTATEVTEILGERQDTVVVREQLRALADQAAAAGESTFTYGLLHARQEARRDELGYRAWETLDMLKSGTRMAGVAVRLK